MAPVGVGGVVTAWLACLAALVGLRLFMVGSRALARQALVRRRGLPVPGQWWELYAQGPVVIRRLSEDGGEVFYELVREPCPSAEPKAHGPGALRSPGWSFPACPVQVFLEQAVRLPGPPTLPELLALQAERAALLAEAEPPPSLVLLALQAERAALLAEAEPPPSLVLVEEEPEAGPVPPVADPPVVVGANAICTGDQNTVQAPGRDYWQGL